jgi:acyl carrier protein
MDPVQEHLTAVLTRKFDIDPDAVRPEATVTDLGLDSLAAVELAVTLQEHWDIEDIGLAEDADLGDATLEKIAEAVRGGLRERRGVAGPGTAR